MEEIEVSNRQKGALGEALIKSLTDLDASYKARVELEPVSSKIRDHMTSAFPELKDDEYSLYISTENSYKFERKYNTKGWYEDVVFTAVIREDRHDLMKYYFPAEIKSGEYAELERKQRETMEELGENKEVVPLLLKLKLDRLPESFELSVRKI